jgi:hypothetical protein
VSVHKGGTGERENTGESLLTRKISPPLERICLVTLKTVISSCNILVDIQLDISLLLDMKFPPNRFLFRSVFDWIAIVSFITRHTEVTV